MSLLTSPSPFRLPTLNSRPLTTPASPSSASPATTLRHQPSDAARPSTPNSTLPLTFTVEEIGKTSIHFSLKAKHDDVDCYDDRAKPCTTTGLFELRKKKRDQLWIPV